MTSRQVMADISQTTPRSSDISGAPSSWAAVVRRVQHETSEREVAVQKLSAYVDHAIKPLTARVEAIEALVEMRVGPRARLGPSSPGRPILSGSVSSDQLDAGSWLARRIPPVLPLEGDAEEVPKPKAHPYRRANTTSIPIFKRQASEPNWAEVSRLARMESDIAKLDNVVAELLQAQIGAVRVQLGDAQDIGKFKLEELREALKKLEVKRHTGEGTWKAEIDALRGELKKSLTAMEERMCSVGMDTVDWEVKGPIEELVTPGERGACISSPSFSLSGTGGFSLHFYPWGHGDSEEGQCALFVSGPPGCASSFVLAVDGYERETPDGISAEGELKGFTRMGEAKDPSLSVPVRLSVSARHVRRSLQSDIVYRNRVVTA
mmetsp:Transcript_7134/g.15430  ORF Transcript_7134/g.15430 Transcript_7134/m.15430 type:complete len:378 (-) Transcript_7134:68-1201(-)